MQFNNGGTEEHQEKASRETNANAYELTRMDLRALLYFVLVKFSEAEFMQ